MRREIEFRADFSTLHYSDEFLEKYGKRVADLYRMQREQEEEEYQPISYRLDLLTQIAVAMIMIFALIGGIAGRLFF